MTPRATGVQRAVDAGFVAALCAVGLLPLATSFAGIGWAVLGGIAVFVGVVLAERAEAWNWPGSVLLVAAFATYVVLAAPAPSVTRELEEMLPTPHGVAEVFRNTVRCWGDLIGTLPRVDSSGPVMLVPLVLGFFAAVTATGLAVMTRSPGLPVLPLAVMIATSLALGRGESNWGVVTGLAFAALSLWWVSLRGRRLTAETPSQGGVRRFLAGLVVLGLAATLAPLLASLVAGERARLVLRETAAQGFDTIRIDTPLRTFRRFTEQEPGTPDNVHGRGLLEVSGLDPGQRLRFVVLDWYDGEQWRPNPDRSPTDSRARYLRLSSTIDNPASGRHVDAKIDVRRAWRSNWVPTAGALQSFDFISLGGTERREDLVYNPETRTALLAVTLRGTDDYRFGARLPDDQLRRSMQAAQGVDEDLYLRASYLDEVAQAYLARSATPMEALFRAAAALKKQGRYSDGATSWESKRFPAGHGLDRLDQQFLHAQQMVGNDEQYAATMALMAIRLGIPARVVVGAVVPPSGMVEGKHVHAWIEVQLTDGSWRTMPTERFMSRQPPKRNTSRAMRPVSQWQPPPAPRPERPRQEQPEKPPTKEKPREQSRDERGDSWAWWLLAGALTLLAIPMAKSVRRHRRRGRRSTSARAVGAWEEVCDLARDLGREEARDEGREWSPGLTRPEEARRLGLPMGLADRADLAIFGSDDPPEDLVAGLWADSMQAGREIRAEAPWWRRLLAPVNPITLLRRR